MGNVCEVNMDHVALRFRRAEFGYGAGLRGIQCGGPKLKLPSVVECDIRAERFFSGCGCVHGVGWVGFYFVSKLCWAMRISSRISSPVVERIL